MNLYSLRLLHTVKAVSWNTTKKKKKTLLSVKCLAFLILHEPHTQARQFVARNLHINVISLCEWTLTLLNVIFIFPNRNSCAFKYMSERKYISRDIKSKQTHGKRTNRYKKICCANKSYSKQWGKCPSKNCKSFLIQFSDRSIVNCQLSVFFQPDISYFVSHTVIIAARRKILLSGAVKVRRVPP